MPLDVMIIDNSTMMRHLLRSMLGEIHLPIGQILQAADGDEGLALAKQTPRLDLILCDWMMPRMDGIAFIKQVRQLGPYRTTPILLISTQATQDKIREAIDSGASAFLEKPFASEGLRIAIEKLLSPMGPKESPPDKKLVKNMVDALVQGVTETFSMMLGVRIRKRDVEVRQAMETLDGVSAIIGMAGKISGCLCLHSADPVAFKIASKLFRKPVESMSPMVEDALGELANMISGSFRRKLFEQKSLFETSLPILAFGKGHSISFWVKWPSTIITFDFDDLPFEVILSVQNAG